MFEQAAKQAARLAALESFKVYDCAVRAHIAWMFVTERLAMEDPELFDALPLEMPETFRVEYYRCAAELSKEVA
jgi:hypothetical protein